MEAIQERIVLWNGYNAQHEQEVSQVKWDEANRRNISLHTFLAMQQNTSLYKESLFFQIQSI